MPRYYFLTLLSILVVSGCSSSTTSSESEQASVEAGIQVSAEEIIATNCAACHADGKDPRAPEYFHLAMMTPRSIVSSLETGKMQIQGSTLSRDEKISVAEFLTQREYSVSSEIPNMCNELPESLGQVKYAGWGGNPHSTGFVEEDVAQLTRANVPNLTLAWAFGIDGATNARMKPSVVGDHLIFGSQFGEVYCVNMQTGCVAWKVDATANIRGGIAISQDISGETLAYFADFGGNTYCVNASSGEILWNTVVKTDPNNAVTGTPAYHDGMLYVPLTSMEVVSAGSDDFVCCTASGQVVALDARNGNEIWRHRVIEQEAKEYGTNRAGKPSYGPSGAPVWSSPTVDAKRGSLYIGTGENNSNPPTTTSDAIQALDLKTGAVKWSFQATEKDAYISACVEGNAANCPDPVGPDVDFGMAPVLTSRPDGSEVLVVGQKSGVVHCLSPDDGSIIWQTRIGRGGALGGVHWGLATDGKVAYISNSDWMPFGAEPDVEPGMGLFALDLMTGDVKWHAAPDPGNCEGIEGCYPTISAAPVMIDGVVFAGSLDGHARAYDAADGSVIWEYDTRKSYETVNGVAGQGGSIDGPGPVVANGMLFINSGYGLFGEMPGNVLLAFKVEQ